MKPEWDKIWRNLGKASGFYDTYPCEKNRLRIERLVEMSLARKNAKKKKP
jgi:hypothetical protein